MISLVGTASSGPGTVRHGVLLGLRQPLCGADHTGLQIERSRAFRGEMGRRCPCCLEVLEVLRVYGGP